MKFLMELDQQADELTDVRELVNAIVNAKYFFQNRDDNDEWMYRGTEVELHPQSGFVSVHKPRQDRRPTSSPNILHRGMDVRFLERFNIPYRSEGLFVTGDIITAKSYGPPVLILPEGQFKFCWSPYVQDAFADISLGDSARYVIGKAKEDGHDVDNLPSIHKLQGYNQFLDDNLWAMDSFNDWLDSSFEHARYTDDDLAAAIKSRHEIMIKCEQYAIIPDRGFIRQYYVDAAEHILGGALDLPRDPDMKEFISAIADKVVQ